MRIALILPLLLLLACATPGPAELRAARFDDLFAQLKAAPDEASARTLERAIQDLWLRTGDPQIDASFAQVMEEGGNFRYEHALALLDDLVETHPECAEVWNQRATLNFLMGRYQESLSDITRTLEREPRHFGALAGQGLVYLRLGEPKRAAKSIRMAQSIDPWLRERVLLPELEAQ